MNGLRVVFVTRRFWPLLGGAENTVAVLAAEMRARGTQPTVITPQWAPEWPSRVFYAGVPVLRLPRPRGQAWGTFRYLHGLRRWLGRNRDQFDLVCVSNMRLEAYTVLSALRGSAIPVVLRAEQAGAAGDCQWHRRTRFGGRVKKKCRAASAVIATGSAVATELQEAGFDARQIHLIPDGVSVQAARSPADRAAARDALREVNSDLKADLETKIVVFIGRLTESNGLMSLVDAWRAVSRAHPEARLWLIGDGPLRDALRERIVDQEMQSSVLLPGTFDDVADILSIASLAVFPSGEAGIPLALLEAVSARLPIVAVDTPGIRVCQAAAGENAQLVSPGDSADLARAIDKFLSFSPPRHAMLAAQRSVEREFSHRRTVEDHLRLFERLSERQLGSYP